MPKYVVLIYFLCEYIHTVHVHADVLISFRNKKIINELTYTQRTLTNAASVAESVVLQLALVTLSLPDARFTFTLSKVFLTWDRGVAAEGVTFTWQCTIQVVGRQGEHGWLTD